MAEIYGTIGIRPMGTYNANTKYELLNLVEYDGSSYVAHTDPPLGTLPTNTDYWQISASGTSKATESTPGTVMPDGVTTEVDSNGALSVKTATQSTAGIVKGSAGIKVAADGSIDVNTLFEQATELGNIIAGEAIASAFGKIAKSIAVTMGLNENALLKNMLTNMDADDSTKIPTSKFVHKLYERIGMGEDLDIGDNLTAVVKSLNSNLSVIGSVYNISPPSYVPCDNGISAEITGFTLPAGTYVISAGLIWSNTVRGGSRRIYIRQGDYYNSLVIAADATDDFVNDAAPLEQSTTGIVTLPTGSNIKLWATQTSGSNLSVESTAFLKAVRIK